MTTLSLTENSIINLSPLTSLAALDYLALANNSIINISPLVQLENLSYLVITGNPVDCDLSAIDTLDANILVFLSDCN